MTKRYDLIIVGAGIVGCSIAYAAAKRGFKTLNLDMLPAAGYGSTSHSSAIVRPIYSHITSALLAHECRSLWLDWPNYLGLPASSNLARYTECGGLVLIPEGHESDYEDNIKAMAGAGIEFKLLSVEEIQNLYPGIDLASYGPPKSLSSPDFGLAGKTKIRSGIFVPAVGYVSDPQLACNNLREAAEALGSRFEFNQRVQSVRVDNKQFTSLETDAKVYTANYLVNAAGPHSAKLNALVAGLESIKTSAMKHEVVYLDASAKHFTKDSGFVIDLDAGFYSRPDGVDMLFGSTDPECDAPQWVDPDDYSDLFTPQWTLQAMRAGQRFPELGISNRARGTVGLYDVSEDWVPIYDKTDVDGYFLAIGTSGNQFKNAPLIGEILCEIINKEQSGLDHDSNPAKFILPSSKRSIDLSFYSRLRSRKDTHSVLA